MKAIRVHEDGGPSVMKLEEVPDPKAGPGDVVVRVRAAGVNPVDAYIHTGTYARKPALPYTPGQDGAGEVESVGADVKAFKTGDRVYICGVGNTVAGAGTYAEQRAVQSVPAPSAAGSRLLRAGIGARRAVLHRLSRAVSAGERQARRDRARARRHRRRRHRRRRVGARTRVEGHRHRRYRRRPCRRARARRRRRRQPSRRRIPRRRS